MKSEDQKDLDHHKARHERIKADKLELELETLRGGLVSRAGVQQAAATAMLTLAQALRSVPDFLERRHGIDPAVAAVVGQQIDESLNECADAFAMLAGPEPVDPDA